MKRIEPPWDYPSEQEFDEFLEEELLDNLGMGKRVNLYRDLCVNKWHHWSKKEERWKPIKDWKKYVRALESKIDSATKNGF